MHLTEKRWDFDKKKSYLLKVYGKGLQSKKVDKGISYNWPEEDN